MCLALPMRIVEIVDGEAKTVRIAPAETIAADRATEEVVSAALIVDDPDALSALVGAWGLVHSGFLLARIDDDDARSRLALFAAMDDETFAGRREATPRDRTAFPPDDRVRKAEGDSEADEPIPN